MNHEEAGLILARAVHDLTEGEAAAPHPALPATTRLGIEIVIWHELGGDTQSLTERLEEIQVEAARAQSRLGISPMTTLLWCQERLLQDPPVAFAPWVKEEARRPMYAAVLALASVGALFSAARDELTHVVSSRLILRARDLTKAAGLGLGAGV